MCLCVCLGGYVGRCLCNIVDNSALFVQSRSQCSPVQPCLGWCPLACVTHCVAAVNGARRLCQVQANISHASLHTHTHGHACDVRRSLWHLGVTKQVAKNSMSRRGHLVFIHLLQLPLPPSLSLSIYLSQGNSSTHYHPLRIRGVGPG